MIRSVCTSAVGRHNKKAKAQTNDGASTLLCWLRGGRLSLVAIDLLSPLGVLCVWFGIRVRVVTCGIALARGCGWWRVVFFDAN